MITPEQIEARESTMMGRPVRLLHTMHAVVIVAGVEHEFVTAVYDASTTTQAQTRWSTYVDGKCEFSGIAAVGSR